MSKCIWLTHSGTSRNTVTQAAVFAEKDLELCVWHWKINGLTRKQTQMHAWVHSWTLPKGKQPALGPTHHFRSYRRKEKLLFFSPLSSLSPMIFSALRRSRVTVNHDSGLWLKSANYARSANKHARGKTNNPTWFKGFLCLDPHAWNLSLLQGPNHFSFYRLILHWTWTMPQMLGVWFQVNTRSKINDIKNLPNA